MPYSLDGLWTKLKKKHSEVVIIALHKGSMTSIQNGNDHRSGSVVISIIRNNECFVLYVASHTPRNLGNLYV